MRSLALAVLLLSLTGCAAVFRGTTAPVQVESTPAGADVKVNAASAGQTPTQTRVKRRGISVVTAEKQGYEKHSGSVRKRINVPWLVVDLGTCIFTFCIPLIIDATTGGWNDVTPTYVAELHPAAPGSAPAPTTSASSTTPAPALNMSESERKNIARTAYAEGVKLQDQGKCPDALARFETAQKFYPAPTHLLHLAQCQAATGRLVEASETYETLTRAALAEGAPEAFRAAQEDGKKELATLRPRIPTLKIGITPALPSNGNVIVKVNGAALPPEIVGLARPVNPGHYKVTVWAPGYKEASAELDVAEGKSGAVDLKLTK